MISTITVLSKIEDTRATVQKHHFHSLGFKSIEDIYLVDIYAIDKNLGKNQLLNISKMLSNPVTQTSTINSYQSPKKFSYAITIGFLPGVTDNIATTAKGMMEDRLNVHFASSEGVYASQVIFLKGVIAKNEILSLAASLYNPIIQYADVKSYTDFTKNDTVKKTIPRVTIQGTQKILEVNLNVTDEELKRIGQLGISNEDGSRRGPLALDLEYLRTIQNYFKKKKRNPTDIELESIAQTWSEHCKHTIFADPIDDIREGLYKKYIQGATQKIRQIKSKKDFCVSVFHDNSGAIEFDDDYLVTHKVETHNSPSALDPFGGAITGIVGVNRDAIGFGLGAKPIANTYGFCFGNPADKSKLYRDRELKQELLSPRRILEGVVQGVNSGGNCSGIPTPQGFVLFHESFRGKPLVFVGTVGLIPKKIQKRKSYIKRACPGDYIVMVGGRVGKDGIHGATFSSEALNSGSPSSAVQIGDPITQKKLSDVLIKEAREKNLYTSITDNGAGGLSCSVSEMAKESGGCSVELDCIPLKYPGLSPWEIWISESQERMTLSVPKSKWKQFSSLMKRRGVESTVIGTFTNSGSCVVAYKKKKIVDLEMDFLHNGLPARVMKTKDVKDRYGEPVLEDSPDFTQILHSFLCRANIAGFGFISSQYDHEVQANSVLKPLQGKGRVNADATVIRPVFTSKKGVVISQGIYPTYSHIDTYHMAACAVDTAIRNLVAVGANPAYIALLDNFCWCSANDRKRLRELKSAAKACYDYALMYQTPYIAGKDSMFNDFNGFNEQGKSTKVSILPTLLISSIGVIEDCTKCISIDLKFPRDFIYVVGETYDQLGGSEYYAFLGEEKDRSHYIGNSVPKVNGKKNSRLYHSFYRCVQKELIASAISVGRGGLITALSKTAMSGQLGLDIEIDKIPGKWSNVHSALFSESQGRIVVSVNPKNAKIFEKMMKTQSVARIGTVLANDEFVVKDKGNSPIIKTDIPGLLKSYKSTFKDF